MTNDGKAKSKIIHRQTDDPAGLQQLLEKVYSERGFDFREYRQTTLTRRVGRRLRATRAESYDQYAEILERSPQEYDRLFDDLTINVTSFFRNKPAFTALEEVALPGMLNGKGGKKKDIQIWSAGCATGEEPYSVAILLLDYLRSRSKHRGIRVLGTDMDPKAVDRARAGLFKGDNLKELKPTQLKRYFSEEMEGFKVRQGLRRVVTFGEHSLLARPPCTGQDLVLCRNVLIYFSPALQVRVLKHLHQSLRPGGFLLLGKAEIPMGETRNLFECIDKKAKLYRKK